MERRAGVLLPIGSLPSEFGIGDLGPGAYAFVDFLAESGHSLWQILPLNPTEEHHGNSPYYSISLFAGNPILISPEVLYKDGLINKELLENLKIERTDRIAYGKVYRNKEHMLTTAFENFKEDEDFHIFCQENAYWLEDYALFSCLHKKYQKPWWLWDESTKIEEREILKEKFVQYIFFKQWKALRNYANSKGIRIVGDLPIYPARDSADVWANKDIFKVDFMAGVPPDYFSPTGQLWGNPVYNWERLKERNFDWWIERIKHSLKLFDLIRLDHFRGFSAFYQVPYGEKTAEKGWWEKAPGYEFFDKVKEEIPQMPFIAEDLGTIDDEVIKLRDHYNLPGMKVLAFAFFDKNSSHLPHNHSYNSVVYTTTHDNMPIKDWFFKELNSWQRARVLDYLGYAPSSIKDALLRLAYMSVSKYCIIPIQDILGLGEEARINTPGKAKGNWEWRLKEIPSEEVKGYMRFLTEIYGRLY